MINHKKIKWAVLFFCSILSLGGCWDELDQEFCCNNPCRSLRPLQYPVSSLMNSYAGSAIGQVIPHENRTIAAKVMQEILKNGEPGDFIEWQIPDATFAGRIQVGPLMKENNTLCRTYRQEIDTPTQTWRANGKACKNPHNVWTIVEER